MQITEQFIMPKTGRDETCEDIIFVNGRFAAVIDGATARNGARYDGKSSGRIAAETVRGTLAALPGNASLDDTLSAVTHAFRDFYESHSIDMSDYSKRLTASSVIFSMARMEIWMIGDCQVMVDGTLHENPNGIDEHVAAVRAMINQAELKGGRSIKWISENDPGAEFIHPLLTTQFFNQNASAGPEGSFAYSAFDGFDIDPSRVKTVKAAAGSAVVMASDGYPLLCPTLKESEAALSSLLERDPLCIYENKCVKGVKPGNVSFDDRSYLRFTV